MKKIYLLAAYIFVCSYAHAQTSNNTEKDYAHSPLWISMIRDTTSNYFEVEKAYNIYFSHHAKPGGENEEIGMHEQREKQPSKREQKKMQADNHMRMEVKKYERWHDKMRPYVQADGTILTPSQRLLIWKGQQLSK